MPWSLQMENLVIAPPAFIMTLAQLGNDSFLVLGVFYSALCLQEMQHFVPQKLPALLVRSWYDL